MRNGKALFACVAFAGAAIGAMASPQITDVTLTPNDAGMVTITYKLTGEDAVVTPDVLTNGVSIGDANIRGFVGDVNKLIAASNVTRTIYWCPRTYLPNWQLDNPEVKLTAWSKANPPDYMAQSIYSPDIRYFYPSAEAIPGGATNRAYKTNLLLMRRIHAAGVEWVSGAPETERAFITNGLEYATILAHAVTLTNDYYIGVYETTVAQFKHIWGKSSVAPSKSGSGLYFSKTASSQFTNDVLFAQPDTFVRPMDKMTWCRLRMDETKYAASYYWPECGHVVNPVAPLSKFRIATGLELDLPTEAQWEFAARAGERGRYEGNYDEIAWHNKNWTNDPMRVACENKNGSHEVGLLKPNAWGLYDMLGNNSEWCLDGIPTTYTEGVTDPYQGAPAIEPIGATGQPATIGRVRRGTSYIYSIGDMSYARREQSAYATYDQEAGFRMVCPATLP